METAITPPSTPPRPLVSFVVPLYFTGQGVVTLLDAFRNLNIPGGCEVVLVSSGAIRLGRTHFRLPPGPLKLEESQAAAATGQIQLAHAYQEALARHGITVAQVDLGAGEANEVGTTGRGEPPPDR